MSLTAVQPVEEIYQHFQSLLLGDLDIFGHFRYRNVGLLWVVLELEVLLLECDGVVDPELRSAFEIFWEGALAEVPGQGVRDVGENEGKFVDKGVGKDIGQSGERAM